MCGIAGIVRFDRPSFESRRALAAMRARLSHRGPDGGGEAFTAHAAVTHTRLAMVDLEGGAQPLWSADQRYLLVYNGELYNDRELRAELGGPWRTRSDAETVVAAWGRWGSGCLARLDGMFAFFLWDTREERGWAARDRLGVKPLAYTTQEGFAFASEARALLPLKPGRPRANLEAVVEHLVAPQFSGVARSPFDRISYLLPGHLLEVSRERVSARAWWRWSPQPEPEADPTALANELRAVLERGVRGSLRAEVPLGVFSSGGIDSATVAALARPALATLPAFTITFEGQGGWGEADARLVVSNDTPYAREVAEQLRLEHREVPFPVAGLATELRAVSCANDALPAWEQELSQRALAREAAGQVRGVLVGDAADELFFGYHFLLDLSDPSDVLARLGSVPIHPEVDPDPVARLSAEYRTLIGEDLGPVGMTRLIVERWLPRLLHNGDIHAMAFGLEARVPFASQAVIAVAERLHPRIGLRDGVEKALLREAVRGLVPERIRTRRKSALPKPQDAGPVYQAELRQALVDPHPLLPAVVDLPALVPLLHRPRLDEPERAQLFRVLALHHWATFHEVAAP